MPAIVEKPSPPSFQFWILLAYLIIIFFTGGGSRIDVQSLLVLRPLSVIACAVAVLTIRRAHFEGRQWIFWGMGALLLLVVLHLVPLPPEIWQGMPGRMPLAEVDRIAGLGDVWRPLTIAPMNGWHTLLSLFAPIAVFLLGVQLTRDDLYRLLPAVIGLGAVSGLFGVLQVISDPHGPLYLYRITNNGSAVGLFANRNHAAVLLACMFPILSTYASTSSGNADRQRARQLLSASIAIILVPLIVVTGSRSGLLISIFGLIAAAKLYRTPKQGQIVRRSEKHWKIGTVPLLGGIIVLCMGFLSILFTRANAVERLFGQSTAENARGEFWSISLNMAWTYFPFGSGTGSFVEAFQIAEPDHLLNANYVNHVHNDWIEVALTAGLPGMLLLLIALATYLVQTVRLWRSPDGRARSARLAKMAAVLITMLALASFTDYPLRTPAMMCFGALCVLWFAEVGRGANIGRAAQADATGGHN